jgi:hypothetical protein
MVAASIGSVDKELLATRVPDLLHFPRFFDEQEQEALLSLCLNLHANCDAASLGADGVPTVEATSIPQPSFERSVSHNLQNEQTFLRLRIHDPSHLEEEGKVAKTLRCEWFPSYGEEGHGLGYFRGNENIPILCRDLVLPLVARHVAPVQQLIVSKALLAQLRAGPRGTESGVGPSETEDGNALSLQWKMTLNTYSMGAAEVPGFPYHVDLPANGPITMIATLRRGATLELRHKDAAAGATPESLVLQPGSLVVLSGEARYEWEHRVLSSPGSGGEEDISRVSTVFGCQ